MRAGSYFEPACNAAGVSKETGYQWQRVAGRTKLRARGEPLDSIDTTAHERRCVAFSDAVAEAESSWEVGALAALQRLAQGGVTTTRTVTKRGPDLQNGDAGPILDITTTTETLLPNAQVLEWRLERRFPGRYGRRVELTGADGGPVALTIDEDDRVEALAETLEAYLQGVADAKPKRRALRKGGVAGRGKVPARGPKPSVVNDDGQDEPGSA